MTAMQGPNAGKLRILIAEDERFERESLAFLVRENFGNQFADIVTAEDGEDAIGKAIAYKPDILLLDIRMPRKSGLDVLKLVRSLGIRSEAAFISAYGQFEYARSAIVLGARDYLLKPTPVEEFKSVMEKLIRQAKNTRKISTILDDEEIEEPDQQENSGRRRVMATIESIDQWIENSVVGNAPISKLAETLGMNPYYLSRLYKSATGKTIKETLLRCKIARASVMLGREGASVKETCYMLGFKNPNYFSTVFSRISGLSPTEFVAKTKTK